MLGTLAAFFGIIFAVNGVFIYRALSTYSGEMVKEPYAQGLAYNERIAAETRQKQLGWADVATVARDGLVSVEIKDANGTPVGDVALAGIIGRPSTDKQDHKLEFKPDGAGHFIAHTTALDAGNWVVTLQAKRGDTSETLYQSRRRVWLKP